jgi:hypothetical protein
VDENIGRLLRQRSIVAGTTLADAVGAAAAEFEAEGGEVEVEEGEDDYMAEAGA